MKPQADHDIRSSGAGSAPSRISAALIENVDVTIETYLGDAAMTIGELTALQNGDVVALETLLSDPVELRVNGVAIARGELVAVGDKFGVRITAVAP